MPAPHCFDNCINWLHQFAFLVVAEHSSRSTFSLKSGIYSSYSNRTRVVSHCGFHLHLMIYVGHLFICLYGISISSSVKYLFKSPAFPFFFFPIELFPYCWVLNYILDTFFFYWIYSVAKIFLPVCGLPFHSLTVSSAEQEFCNFIKVYFITFQFVSCIRCHNYDIFA